MPHTPILNLPLMTASQAQKEVVFNELAIAFDSLFKGSVLDTTLANPPLSPALGDAYIIAASATGAWASKDHNVAFYYNGWQFVTPSLKMRLYSVAQSEFFVFQTSGSWTAEPTSTVSVLNDLTNVSGSPTNGQLLQFSTTDNKWHPWTITYPPLALSALSDVAATEGSGIDQKALVWNNAASKWEPTTILLAAPHLLSLPDVLAASEGEGKVLVYGSTDGPGSTPGVHFVDPATLITVSSLNQVGDVSYPVGGVTAIASGAALIWSGAAWVPSSAAATYAVENLSNGPGAMTGKAHYLVRVASSETAWEYVDPMTIAGSTLLSELLDLSVAEGSAINGYVLYWNQTDTKWEAKPLATVAATGAYSDLSGKPTLATVATSGAYSDLSGKPTIPTNGSFNLASLGDVSLTEGSGVDGQVLYWNNGAGKFALKGAGGGALSTLSDVSVTEGAGIDGYRLTWNNSSGKWTAVAPAALATVATSGAYSDLTGKPSLSTVATSGAYSDLSGRPSLSTVATTGAYSDLTGRPLLATVATTGAYSDLSGNPTIPTNGSFNLAALGDVTITSVANGQALVWNSTASKWENVAPTLAALTDVSVSSPTAGNLLIYSGSAWQNKATADLASHTVGSVTGAVALDRANGETQIITVAGDITGITVTNWGGSGTLSKLNLVIINTGAFTVALPGAKWPGGAVPTVTSGSAIDLYTFLTYDSGASLLGNVVGKNFF